MAAPTSKNKWGSLLSQAVAGVESRLDSILADDEPSEKPAAGAPPRPTPSSTPSQQGAAGKAPQRTGSGNKSKAQDRLQERLARAVAAKQGATGSQVPSAKASPLISPRQSLDLPSRASTDSALPSAISAEEQSGRASQESAGRSSHDVQRTNTFGAPAAVAEKDDDASHANGKTEESNGALPAPASASFEEINTGDVATIPLSNDDTSVSPHALEELKLKHQTEIHEYIERIDALQAKLQYLARETTDAARKAAKEAPNGSTEKILAQKDEQIAGLMEEGKKLSSEEHKLRAVIKTLRTKMTADQKEHSTAASSRTKLEAELDNMRKKARRVDDLEKYQQELHRRIGASQKDSDGLKSELSARDATIANLKHQLQEAGNEAKALTAKINDEALAKERQRVRDLEETVSDLKVEKELAVDRGKTQVKDLQDKAERAAERTRAAEVEMKTEMQSLESRLEVMRVRAEESSSSAMGDSQAKLLRQVETLQTQYSIASENWQGIESTLLARIGNLEKERDDAQQRESDMRKKAREAAVRAKRREEELEDANTRLPSIQEDVKSYQSELGSLKTTAANSEKALMEARDEVEKLKTALREAKAVSRDGAGSSAATTPWMEDFPVAVQRSNSRPESPLASAHPSRTQSSDFLGLGSLSAKFRKASAASSNGDPMERFASRRSSAVPPSTRPSIMTGTGSNSGPFLSSLFSPTTSTQPDHSMPPPPSIHRLEHSTDTVDNAETASSHQVAQDMISVSTVGAGPSVQLVERMSAAVRRLETEKVAAREELARISSQRDEARAEIVTLMREAEAGKDALKRVTELEAEVAQVNERYETTLQMYGEKTELVDELRADVADLKSMYRELVESTVK